MWDKAICDDDVIALCDDDVIALYDDDVVALYDDDVVALCHDDVVALCHDIVWAYSNEISSSISEVKYGDVVYCSVELLLINVSSWFSDFLHHILSEKLFYLSTYIHT